MAHWTETEWLECISPEPMLAQPECPVSMRKKRLFACACVRRIWPLLIDARLREAVELAERSADGKASARAVQQELLLVGLLREELQEAEERQATWTARARRAAAQAVEALLPANGPLLEAPRDPHEPPDVVTATRIARTAARAAEAQREQSVAPPATPSRAGMSRPLESLDAVDLIHEIFGNPFRPVTVDPAWLAWNNHAIVKLARVSYDEHGRDLPILADALEEAGCAETTILGHCRESREHVRGCWVVDALLGMK